MGNYENQTRGRKPHPSNTRSGKDESPTTASFRSARGDSPDHTGGVATVLLVNLCQSLSNFVLR